MTISALGELASRRTADARKVAVQRLEAMRKAALVIGQAETHAECKIPLDVSLVKRVNLLMKRSANGDIQNSDYLTTLEISEKAAAARDEILRTANQALKVELESREKAKHREARGLGRPSQPDRPSLGFSLRTGFSVTAVSAIFACCMSLPGQLNSTADRLKRERDSAVAVAKLKEDYQAAQKKAKSFETPRAKEDRFDRGQREQDLKNARFAVAELEKVIQAKEEEHKAYQAAVSRSQARDGGSAFVTLVWIVLIIGMLGFILVPGIIYGIWGLRCNAAKASTQRFDDRLQGSLARLEAEQQKVEDALDLLAALGPVRAAATPPPMPKRKAEYDDEYEDENKDDDDDGDGQPRRHRAKAKRMDLENDDGWEGN